MEVNHNLDSGENIGPKYKPLLIIWDPNVRKRYKLHGIENPFQIIQFVEQFEQQKLKPVLKFELNVEQRAPFVKSLNLLDFPEVYDDAT